MSGTLITEIGDFIGRDLLTATIYLEILKNPKNEDELLNLFPNTKKQVNEGINYLSKLCLISDLIQRDRTRLFFPIDPQLAFSSIVLQEMWNNDVNYHTLDDIKNNHENDYLYQKYLASINIIRQVKGIYKRKLPFLKELAVVVNGSRKIPAFLSDILATAESEIFAAVSPPHLMGPLVWQTVTEKMKQGISYKRITTFGEINRHGYVITKKEVSNINETLYISKNNKLPQKFYVVNDLTVIFFIPDTNNNDFKFEVQIVKNGQVAKRYRNVFMQFVQESYLAVDLLEKISIYRDKLIQESEKILTKKQLNWFIDVFDFGVFCDHKKYSRETYESAKAICLQNDLIVENSNNELYINYSIEEIL